MMIRVRLVILVILGSCFWLSGCSDEEDMVFWASNITDTTYVETVTGTDCKEEKAVFLVYVCGAVQNPGVVAVNADARVVDAVTLAGGMTAEADETYVNLAAKLTDGEKIYIPTMAEVLLWNTQKAEESLVNINTADKEKLCTLPGIGESKAEEIIAYREKNGAFQKVEDLMKVPGIKENLYEKLQGKIKTE